MMIFYFIGAVAYWRLSQADEETYKEYKDNLQKDQAPIEQSSMQSISVCMFIIFFLATADTCVSMNILQANRLNKVEGLEKGKKAVVCIWIGIILANSGINALTGNWLSLGLTVLIYLFYMGSYYRVISRTIEVIEKCRQSGIMLANQIN